MTLLGPRSPPCTPTPSLGAGQAPLTRPGPAGHWPRTARDKRLGHKAWACGQQGRGPISGLPPFRQLPPREGQGPAPRDTLAGTAAWLIQKETQDMATRRMEGM